MTDQEMQQRAKLFRKLVDRFGDEVLDVVAEHTIEQTRQRLESADLQRRDLDMVMELLWDTMGENADYIVETRTANQLKLKVTRCVIADEMRRLDAADVGFAFYCAYDEGFSQGLNPKIKFTRSKTLMQGDDCCNHQYELA